MLPGVVRSHDPALEVPLVPEVRQELQRLLESLSAAVVTAPDALVWTCRFWQPERKDAVNKRGVKIGAKKLPAVTQLFTERYIVLFLLRDTVGAGRAGRILVEKPELAATAANEDELRRAVRLVTHGGYDFAYLRFVREPRDGAEANRPCEPWRPAAGPDGEGRRRLETLTYRHLGDWLARQKADRDHDAEGADGRLAAAQDLKSQLVKIMAGEPPCDLFVRWKPIGEQPLGWEPDVNDGVRINIRPFMSAELARGGRAGAGILRARPKINWRKDRGKEAIKPRKRWTPPWLDEDDNQEADVDEDRELRPREEYPWFWNCPGDGTRAERTDSPGGTAFDGNRWNDLHYTNAVKRAARRRVQPTAVKEVSGDRSGQLSVAGGTMD